MPHPKNTDFWQKSDVLRSLPYHGILRKDGSNRPIYLRVETVNTCNNDCMICAYGDQTRPKEVMPQSTFEKAVRDYADLGGGFLSFTPLVGDFFLDRHLLDRLRFLETIPEITGLGVTTNGAMAHRFDDGDLSYIISRFSHLSISIYGTDAVEYEAMARKKTYHRMIEGVRRILSLAPIKVSLEFRLLNSKSKETLYDWVEREVQPAPSADYFINSAITDYANWGIYSDANNPLTGDAKWFASERREQKQQCLIPIFACIVYSSGNVSFCPCDNYNDAQELRIGNILQESLTEMYNSDRAIELWNWEDHGTPEFCKACSFHIGIDLLRSDPDILTNPHKIVGAG
jgi:MoaA/NifB/PqqE/SkfB family radical SAM enzyme